METRSDVGDGRPANRLPASRPLGRDGMLLLLTWTAGSVDAISYLGLGHVFAAMMTGNTVLLGLAIAQGQVLAAFRSIPALGGFGGGVAMGALIARRDRRHGEWPPAVTDVIALEAVLLVYGLGALIGGVLQARSSFVTLSPLVAVAAVVVNATTRHGDR